MSKNVPKKTAVITGSTKGIGRGIALRLVQEQYNVVLNYTHDDIQAQETLHLCQQIHSGVLLVKADVSKKGDVERLMQTAFEHFGALDVLINNAAFVADKPLHALTEEDWDEVVNVNMKGTFLCAQIASAYMLAQEQGGSIINIGAHSGIRGRKNGINTCASKAGVMVMTRCLALELAPKIRVNTIMPGSTYTEEAAQRFHWDDPVVRRTKEEAIPLGRMGTPEDVARVVFLLLSPDAEFINGQSIGVDGGQYMW